MSQIGKLLKMMESIWECKSKAMDVKENRLYTKDGFIKYIQIIISADSTDQ